MDREDIPRPLLEHLGEARERVIKSGLFFLLSFFLFYGFSDYLFQLITAPLGETFQSLGLTDRRLIFTGLTEAFSSYIKLSAFGSLFVSLPYMGWHLWRFVAPGLYENEKALFTLALIIMPLLFALGALFAYFVVCPMAYKFFLSFESTGQGGLPIQLEARVGEYLSFMIRLMMAFGMCFQLPLVMVMLVKAKLITKEVMKRKWRIAVVIIFAVSALITPPDMVSMMALALPLCGLYGFSLILIE